MSYIDELFVTIGFNDYNMLTFFLSNYTPSSCRVFLPISISSRTVTVCTMIIEASCTKQGYLGRWHTTINVSSLRASSHLRNAPRCGLVHNMSYEFITSHYTYSGEMKYTREISRNFKK